MENKNQIPTFVRKTYQILQVTLFLNKNPQCQSVIDWTSNQKEFIVKSVACLQRTVLPRYFRHSNFNSFVRQLNMYGFHKSRKDSTKIVFSHESFVKENPSLLLNIKRRQKTDQVNDENIMPSQNNGQKSFSPLGLEDLMNEDKNMSKVQNNVNLKQNEAKQPQTTQQNIKSCCSIDDRRPAWSVDHGCQQFQTKYESPFRCFIEKSEIFDFKPQIYLQMAQKENDQNGYQLNLNDDCQIDSLSIDEDIQFLRDQNDLNLNERIPSIKTFNFLNQLYF